jgi:hypothetical protein
LKRHAEDIGPEATTPEAKGKIFQEVFFPKPPEADLSDISTTQYPEPLPFPNIENHEVMQVLLDAPAGKAPGEDTIPNGILHTLAPVIVPYLTNLYSACLKLGYNPSHFRASITVVLRKGGARNYRLAKSYRPVALLNTIGKGLESVVARRISYMLDSNNILPPTHLGGRKGISTEHAVLHLIDRIRRTWGKGRPVVTMVLLDVSGSYDNVAHKRLLHDIKKQRLGRLVPWISSFLTNRSTRIKMTEGKTIGQALRRMEYQIQAANNWAEKHASVFDPKKFQLIHFVNPEGASIIKRQDKPFGHGGSHPASKGCGQISRRLD